MPITRTTLIDDDGSGTTGSILNNAWLQTIYNQIDAYVGGVWLNLPYAAGNYAGGSGGTWTVLVANQTAYAYQVTGKTMLAQIYLSSTTVTGAPVTLNVALPAATSAANGQTFVYSAASGVGNGFATTSGSTILLYRDILGTPWPAGTVHLAGMFLASLA